MRKKKRYNVKKYIKRQEAKKKKYGKQPFVNDKGYPEVYVPKRGYMLLHRLVAERAIGRKLRYWEQVHHVDGDKLNASPKNLVVCTAKYHKELHRRCKQVYGTWHLPKRRSS